MEKIVHSFITKHQLIEPCQTVIVAVSGGPDSMALLHYLLSRRESLSLRLVAVSVDHGLRGEQSIEDLDYVKQTCEHWNVEFRGTSVDVQSYKQKTALGTQEAARELRYRFFEEVMDEMAGDVLALGHHGDDQAETIMMQIVRSARPEAIQGMPAHRPFATGKIVRPFLCLSKKEIEQYASLHQLHPRIDASNEETDYTRNAFRKHVMPFLKEQNPKLHRHMQALSERAREDRFYIREEAEKVLETIDFPSKMNKIVQFSIETFKTFPLALQRSAFHLILNYLYDDQTEEISYLHEEMFVNLLYDQKPNVQLDFPGGLKVIRAYDDMTLTFENAEGNHDHAYHHSLHIGDSIELPDGSVLTAEWSDQVRGGGAYDYVCDSHHVTLPLIVRSRQPGDRMRIKGMNGSKKVKDIFIDQKIPAQLRKSWPLVTDSTGEILWLIGLKKGGECTGDTSGTWLRLQYKNKADV